MKRNNKAISFILILCMMITIMPLTPVMSVEAEAAEAIEALDLTNKADGTTGPGWSWSTDGTKGTLILDGINITMASTTTDAIYGIMLPANSTISLAPGSANTIRSTSPASVNSWNIGIYILGGASDTALITGSGSLNVESGATTSHSYAIKCNSQLKIENTTIQAIGGPANYSYGIYAGYNSTVKYSTITATGGTATSGSCGFLQSNGKLTISESTMNATGGDSGKISHGIDSREGITITGNQVSAAGGSVTNATLGTLAECSAGIYSSGSTPLIISGGSINAKGGNANTASYGILGTNINFNGGYTLAKSNAQTTSYAIYSAHGVAVNFGFPTAKTFVTSPTLAGPSSDGKFIASVAGGTTSAQEVRIAPLVWDGYVSTQLAGSGTSADPYLISCAADLAYMRNQVNKTAQIYNGTSSNYAGSAYYKQTEDIILNDGTFDENGNFTATGASSTSTAVAWVAIGNGNFNGSASFKGSYDGNNKTIKGLYINNQEYYQGLFGLLHNASISGIGLIDNYIKGAVYVGGIAGLVSALSTSTTSISHCYNSGTVKGSTYVGGIVGDVLYNFSMDHVYNTGTVIGNDSVGGLVGYFIFFGSTPYTISINTSFNTGTVRGSNKIGGIIGDTEGSTQIIRSYNTGMIIGSTATGGIAGSAFNNFTIKGTYNAGAIIQTGSTANANIASLVGSCAGYGMQFDENYYDKQISYRTAYGNSGTDLNLTPKLTSEMIGTGLQSEASSDYFGSDYWEFTSGLYPRLKGMEDLDASLVSANPALLSATNMGDPDTVIKVRGSLVLSTYGGVQWVSAGAVIMDPSSVTVDSTGITLSAVKSGLSRSIFLKAPVQATSVASVVISGTEQIGQTLTATVSPAGATANYQWKSGGANISGATSSTYVIQSSDATKQISVQATGTGNYSGTVLSSPTIIISAAAQASPALMTAKFTKDQLFDVQRSPAFPQAGQPIRISGMKAPYTQNYPTQADLSNGNYVKFEYYDAAKKTVGQQSATIRNSIINSVRWYFSDTTKLDNATVIKEVLYNSSNQRIAVLSDFGLIWALQEQEGFLYTALNGSYKSSGGIGTFVSFKPYKYGSSITYVTPTSDPTTTGGIEVNNNVIPQSGTTGGITTASISGSIVDKDDGSTPLPGFNVNVTYGGIGYSDQTDENGNYDIDVPYDPNSKSYDMTFTTGTSVSGMISETIEDSGFGTDDGSSDTPFVEPAPIIFMVDPIPLAPYIPARRTPVSASGITVSTNTMSPVENGKIQVALSGAISGTIKYRILENSPTTPNVSSLLLGEWTAPPSNTFAIAVTDGSFIEVVGVIGGKIATWGVSSATNDGYTAPSNYPGRNDDSDSDSQNPNNPNAPGTPGYKGNNGEILIGNKPFDGGKADEKKQDGKKTTVVTFDEKKFDDLINGIKPGDEITIPIYSDSDDKRGEFSGKTIDGMNEKRADLVIKTDEGTFTLSAGELDLPGIIAKFEEKFGLDVNKDDLKITITIGKGDQDKRDLLGKMDANSDFKVVVPPVKFIVTAEVDGKVIQLDLFETYVEHSIPIPPGVDPKSISTVVVVDEDGSGRIRQVPTKIVPINGGYQAVFQSLKNDTFALISNPVAFQDAKNRWFEAAVNDMGSRKIVTGINGEFQPDRSITRVEFASILVNSLGLPTATFDTEFTDLEQGRWFTPVAETAASYGLATGITSTRFGVSDNITRQQAMTMVARAMRFTGIYPDMNQSEIDSVLSAYKDADQISEYAKVSVAACLETGAVKGKTATTIDPRASISRAEVASVIRRLLQKSGLI